MLASSSVTNSDAHSHHAELHSEMVAALNGKSTKFQLVPRHHFYKELITTKAWMIQMDKVDSSIWLPAMLQTFPLHNTNVGIQIVPFSNSANDTDRSVLLQKSTKTTLLEIQRLNKVTTRMSNTLQAHTNQMAHRSNHWYE